MFKVPKETDANLDAARAESLRMVNISGKFVKQLKKDNAEAEFAFEWPKGVAGWREDAVQSPGKYLPHESIMDGCAVGLRDSDGMALMKPWRVVSSSSALTSP